MFSGITVKNFKSLVDMDIDFTIKKGTANKLVIIYGENGSGKSNIMELFDVLTYSVRSLLLYRLISIHESNIFKDHKIYASEIANTITSGEQRCSLEYRFIIDGKEGSYNIIFDKTGYCYESLRFVINTKVDYFFIAERSVDGSPLIKISPSFTSSKKFKKNILDDAEKFWGRHSLLALIFYNSSELSPFGKKRVINENFLSCMAFLASVQYRDNDNSMLSNPFIRQGAMPFLDEIPIETSDDIDYYTKAVDLFLTRVFADIKKAYYIREGSYYRLYVDKMIGGKLRSIGFENESSGTKRLIGVLPYLLNFMHGCSVAIDEVDSNIHDMAISAVFSDILDNYDELQGQLICTTHNLSLLDAIKQPNFIYFIDVDREGNKELICLRDYSPRSTNNIRKCYMEGKYGGIPLTQSIDLNELAGFFK